METTEPLGGLAGAKANACPEGTVIDALRDQVD